MIFELLESIDLLKGNEYTLKEARNRQYQAETMTDADDRVFLANTLAQSKSLLHSLYIAGGYY